MPGWDLSRLAAHDAANIFSQAQAKPYQQPIQCEQAQDALPILIQQQVDGHHRQGTERQHRDIT
jgi:hypothetical protein